MRLSPAILACAAIPLSIGCASAAAPVIQRVQNAANYQPVIASAAWIAITGTDLATSTRAWTDADFAGGNLPLRLDDVRVSINGRPAYVYFISPGQINVLGPDDPAIGTVPVQVTNSQGASNVFSAEKQVASPALFAYPQRGGAFAVSQSGSDFGLVAPPRLLGPTVPTSTVAPGSNLILYGTGLGPVTPAQPSGVLVTAPAATATAVVVTIGGQPAPVSFAGLIGAGLYQVNVTVPPLRTGDALIAITAAGRKLAGSVSIPVGAYGDASGQTAPPLAGCVTGAVDYVTYNTALLSHGQTVDASIAGKQLCPSCAVQAPIYPEFTALLEHALESGGTVQACYDKNGQIFQVKELHR